VGDHTAIEVKATRKAKADDVRGLVALGEEGIVKQRSLASEDPVEVVRQGVRCLPWGRFVEELWSDELL
jgi:hypothetical protein